MCCFKDEKKIISFFLKMYYMFRSRYKRRSLHGATWNRIPDWEYNIECETEKCGAYQKMCKYCNGYAPHSSSLSIHQTNRTLLIQNLFHKGGLACTIKIRQLQFRHNKSEPWQDIKDKNVVAWCKKISKQIPVVYPLKILAAYFVHANFHRCKFKVLPTDCVDIINNLKLGFHEHLV